MDLSARPWTNRRREWHHQLDEANRHSALYRTAGRSRGPGCRIGKRYPNVARARPTGAAEEAPRAGPRYETDHQARPGMVIDRPGAAPARLTPSTSGPGVDPVGLSLPDREGRTYSMFDENLDLLFRPQCGERAPNTIDADRGGDQGRHRLRRTGDAREGGSKLRRCSRRRNATRVLSQGRGTVRSDRSACTPRRRRSGSRAGPPD